jgi:tetratricopeptide (TPR) repeat protein
LLDGERLIGQGQFEQAVEKLRVAVNLMSTNAQAWNHLGLAFHGAGQPAQALVAYQRALACDPNLATASFNLGALYLEQNNLAAAIPSLTTFTLLQPSSVEGRLMLASAQWRARQLDAAERTYREALQLDPHLAEALNGLGMIDVQRRRYADARAQFLAALGAQPHYPPALLNLAVVSHRHLNQRTFALEKYRQYVALEPPAPNRDDVAIIASNLDTELNPPPRLDPTNLVARLLAPTNAPTRVSDAASARPAGGASAAGPAGASLPARALSVPLPGSASSSTSAALRPATRITESRPSAAPAAAATTPASAAARPPDAASAPARSVAIPPSRQEPPAAPRVVQVQDEPPIRTVPDVAGASPGLASAPAASPSTAPGGSGLSATPAASPAGITAAAAAPDAVAPNSAPGPAAQKPSAPARKRTIVQKLSPGSWFAPKARKPTPLPDSGRIQTPSARVPAATQLTKAEPTQPRSAPESAASADVPAPAPATSPSPPPRPAATRYTYAAPAAPAPGNRKVASAAFQQAQRAQRAGSLAEAADAYGRAAQADPAWFEAQYNLAVASYAAGRLTQALESYEVALALQPDSLSARYNFALALLKARHPQDAAQELERVLSQHPDEARAHFTLAGILAEDLFQGAGARRHYERALELDPQHPQAAAIRAWLADNP